MSRHETLLEHISRYFQPSGMLLVGRPPSPRPVHLQWCNVGCGGGAQAKNSLESALKPRSTLSSVEKTAVLSAALDQADAVLQSKLPLATAVNGLEGNASTEEGGLAGVDGEASPSPVATASGVSHAGGLDSDAAKIEEDLKAVSPTSSVLATTSVWAFVASRISWSHIDVIIPGFGG